jgi:hypothetical protein
MPMSLKCASSLLKFCIYFAFLLLLNVYYEENIWSKLFNYFMLVSCLAYSSVLKMETICSSETSVDPQRATRRYIQEGRTLHNHRCQNLKSYKERWRYHVSGIDDIYFVDRIQRFGVICRLRLQSMSMIQWVFLDESRRTTRIHSLYTLRTKKPQI